MKRIRYYFLVALLAACNDGDLQIETIDFDSITNVQSCDSPINTTSTVFFKINSAEALILTLPSGTLKNEVDTLISTVPSQSKLTYRLFSEAVTNTYFCSAVPVTSPTVLDEINAEGGEIIITTTTTDSITYSHKIELSGISFVTASNTRITDLRINDFGTLTTKTE
jgi:hypothetical protein